MNKRGLGLKLRTEPLPSEKLWRSQVKTLATATGWKHYYNPDSVGCVPGFPDLVLTRNGRVIFAELKRDAKDSKPTEEQLEWIQHLSGCARKHMTPEEYEEALITYFESLLWVCCAVILRPRHTQVLTTVLTTAGTGR